MITTLGEAKNQLDKAVDHFDQELNKIRTGRANASILDGVMVKVYGQDTPLKHVSNVNALDAQTLQITPFDPNNLDAISAAIRDDQSLGLNPADDGRVIRIPIPPMNEERRREVVKQVGEKLEEAKISFRNTRHELLKHAKQQEKDSEITKDDYIDLDKNIGDTLDEYTTKIEETAKTKEQEIMTV
jgi:ribosome recycling factor